VPGRDQSGGTDKQLRISKCGDGLLRRTIGQRRALHPRAVRPGLRAARLWPALVGTSAREKKRAVVAVARKLAVLLLSLWKHGTDYEPRVPALPALVMVPA